MQYDALTPEAQERALQCVREMEQQDWSAEYYLSDIACVLHQLGFNVSTRTVKTYGGRKFEESDFSWSLGYCQDDGFTFKGTWTASNMDAAKLLEDRPTNTKLHAIVGRLMAIAIVRPEGHCCIGNNTYGSRSMTCMAECPDQIDEDEPAFMSDELIGTMDDILKDICRMAYEELRDGYESDMEDERLREAIEANEWEFVESGEALA